jgi:hypothetical protein
MIGFNRGSWQYRYLLQDFAAMTWRWLDLATGWRPMRRLHRRSSPCLPLTCPIFCSLLHDVLLTFHR